MIRFAYLGMLGFVVLTTLPLELYLGVRVWRRFRRLLLSVLPVAAVFAVWDLYAIAQDHWDFHPEQTTGVVIGTLPLEEILFFLIIPVAAIMTLEAVRVVRGWPVGDEVAEVDEVGAR